jgi:hypothetical protein
MTYGMTPMSYVAWCDINVIWCMVWHQCYMVWHQFHMVWHQCHMVWHHCHMVLTPLHCHMVWHPSLLFLLNTPISYSVTPISYGVTPISYGVKPMTTVIGAPTCYFKENFNLNIVLSLSVSAGCVHCLTISCSVAWSMHNYKLSFQHWSVQPAKYCKDWFSAAAPEGPPRELPVSSSGTRFTIACKRFCRDGRLTDLNTFVRHNNCAVTHRLARPEICASVEAFWYIFAFGQTAKLSPKA